MEFGIGLLLGLGVAVFASSIGLDRDRAFYPTVMIVIAAYYILFAAMGASNRTLTMECLAAAAFATLAVIGFRQGLWWVAGALVGHGVFDFVHHWLIQDPGVPVWWPGFCMTCDVVLGAYLAVRLLRSPESR